MYSTYSSTKAGIVNLVQALAENANANGVTFMLNTEVTDINVEEGLKLFREKVYRVIVTSKVLNEGVDVPAVALGSILSGSGSVREHVQRLGRILRPAPGKKQAELYELVSAGTGEENISIRRRDHRAYQNHDSGEEPC